MKIAHIITSLGDGGAEHTLYKICKYDTINQHAVIVFKKDGKYFTLLGKLGIKVYCLDANFFSIQKFFLLIKILRSIKPDIVQTWLVHADFIGSIASRLAGIKKIVWNIRYSKIEVGKAKLITVLMIEILVWFSYFFPKSIIIVSKNAKRFYEEKGYDKKKLKFIPNGYDLSIFKIRNKYKNNFRKKMCISKSVPIIGYVARYDPLKDHVNLLKSISLIKSKNAKFFCVFIGYNINNNSELIKQVKRLKLNNHIKLLAPTKNISKIMNILDIHVQSSRSEGFPNVVAEAMAHKTPCIVTNVGDLSYIVGKTGWVVPPKDSKKLAMVIKNALSQIGNKNWHQRCNGSRKRIEEKFNMNRMIKAYNMEWKKVYKSANTN